MEICNPNINDKSSRDNMKIDLTEEREKHHLISGIEKNTTKLNDKFKFKCPLCVPKINILSEFEGSTAQYYFNFITNLRI